MWERQATKHNSPLPRVTTVGHTQLIDQATNDRQNLKCVHIHNWTRTLFIGGRPYGLAFRSGIVDFIQFKIGLVPTRSLIFFL